MQIIKRFLFVLSLLVNVYVVASEGRYVSRFCAQDEDGMEMNDTAFAGYDADQNSNRLENYCSYMPNCSQVSVPSCLSMPLSEAFAACRTSIVDCGESTSLATRNCVACSGDRFNALSKGGKKCCVGSVCCLVLTGIIVGSLVATANMTYNNYHEDNLTNKVLNLHYRGNGANDCEQVTCSHKQSCKTDSDGHKTCSNKKTCSSHQVDCVRTLYKNDRTTIRNFGHLTKLCARYYDPYYGWESGSTECVTNHGLQYTDWVLHDYNHRIVWTRQDDYNKKPDTNTTSTAYQYSINEIESNRLNQEQACSQEYIYVDLDDHDKPLLTRRKCYNSTQAADADRAA